MKTWGILGPQINERKEDKMTMGRRNFYTKGTCKHGEFDLAEGCPDCIQEERERRAAAEAEAEMTPDERERAKATINPTDEEVAAFVEEARREEVPEPEPEPIIVKVRYISDSGVIVSGREYAYFSAEVLKVGDVVQVPVRDRVQKAVVTAIDITENEIADFRFDVKTIPVGSIFPGAQAPPEEAAVAEPEEEVINYGPGGKGANTYGPAPTETKPPALAVIESQIGRSTTGLFSLYQEAASLLQVAKKRVITTNEDLKPATDDLAIIAVCKKAMFARKTEIVEPFKAKLDLVNQAFADLMFPILEADRLTRGQVTTFDNEQRRKTAEAQRIEDEKLKLAQDEMKLTGEHTQELGTAVAPPPVPERTRTDLGTLGGRTNWKARVVDFALLPDEYKLPNEPLLNSFARSTKGERPIPGVEFYDDRVVTMRTR